MVQRSFILLLLAGVIPVLCLAAETDLSSTPQSYYSAELSTDISGSSTLIFDVNAALASRNRLQIGIGRSETPNVGLGLGQMLSAGYSTDPEKSASYGISSEYWRLSAASGNNIEILTLSGSGTRYSDRWSLSATPGAKKINIHILTPSPAEIVVTSGGLTLAATYYTRGKWSFSTGIEENRYFGDAATLRNIISIIKFTGKAPFLASLVRSRYYFEADYGFTDATLTLGLDMNKTVIQRKYKPSVYIRSVSGLSDSWSLQTQLGTNSVDFNGWFVSLGLTYAH